VQIENDSDFSLEGHDYIELFKLLKITGICNSGGEAKLLIADKQVQVDGEIELRKRCKLRSGQVVNIHDASIRIRS